MRELLSCPYRVAHEAKAFYTVFRGHGDDCAVIRFHIPVLRRPYVKELPQVAAALCYVGSRADMREEATHTVHRPSNKQVRASTSGPTRLPAEKRTRFGDRMMPFE